MTETHPTAASPDGSVTLLEARALTKHFPVHGGTRSSRRRRHGRAALAGLGKGRGTIGGQHTGEEHHTDQRPPAPEANGPAAAPRARHAVVHAVEQISLTLAAGGITAIVGESGSGKSTLARMLARLIKPTSGQIFLEGREVPVGAHGRREYARDVQMVLQDPFSSLNPVHSIRYHLSRPLIIHRMAGRGAALEQALCGLLQRVALTPPEAFLDKYPHELSGGQRQRVAIARALAVRPRVLLADEPVSMLDVSIRLGVLNLLAGLREDERLAILYITHDIASARYLADDIVVMYAGQMVESGPATTVTDQPAHPYTTLLLSAAPDPDRAEPPTIAGRGAPPSLVTPPGGCRFHPRCPHAMAVCTEQVPPAFEVSNGHNSACWLHTAGLPAAQSRPLPGRERHLVPSPAAGGQPPAAPRSVAAGEQPPAAPRDPAVPDPGKET